MFINISFKKNYLMLCSNAQTFQHLLHAISAKGFSWSIGKNKYSQDPNLGE